MARAGGIARTVITGVQPGNSLGKIPLTAPGLPASITGQVTSSTGSAGVPVDVTISVLLSIGNSVRVTVPLAQQSSSTATIATVPDTCPTGTDCMSYTLSLPASNASVGPANTTGDQSPAAPPPGPVSYDVDGTAFVLGTTDANCSPPELQSTVNNLTAGNPFTAAALVFNSCQ